MQDVAIRAAGEGWGGGRRKEAPGRAGDPDLGWWQEGRLSGQDPSRLGAFLLPRAPSLSAMPLTSASSQAPS